MGHSVAYAWTISQDLATARTFLVVSRVLKDTDLTFGLSETKACLEISSAFTADLSDGAAVTGVSRVFIKMKGKNEKKADGDVPSAKRSFLRVARKNPIANGKGSGARY